MRTAIASILFYLFGVMVFLTIADFSIEDWKKAYHLWDKLKDVLFLTAIYNLLPKYRKVIRWPIVYALARVIWEIIAWITDMDINHPKAVLNLFTVLASALTALLLNELRQWQRQKLS